MPLDWDVLLDAVSIKTQIGGFQIRESKGAYARELTLFAADPDFYDLFDYTTIPALRIEIKTKIATTWISQGSFYIERPGIFATPDGIMSPGVWGRSETAVAGPPFAAKITKNWTENTTFNDIFAAMAALCGLTVTSYIDNYPVFANSYAVDGMYPIDVISDLADLAGAHVGCTPAGVITIQPSVFHPAAADYTITDADISDMSEHLEYPEFGNRIRISAIGAGAGYQITLQALNNDDCLPADGVSKGTLLAFVTDNEGTAVPDNTIVAWTIEDGATLENEHTNTGNYLLSNRKYLASNYYTVDVDFPIADVIGIWAYADAGNNNNFWDEDYGSFEGKTITVGHGFTFCDQALRITYVTGGCAVNRVIAGSTAIDVEVTADVEGANDVITIHQGNVCACGSSLNIKANPAGSICLGNLAHVLVWATINNAPATGYYVQLRKIEGCGELSSENKKFKTVEILNETSHVNNVITGVSQVETAIIPAASVAPKVYLKGDTAKVVNLYSSNDGKIIDLTTLQTTGQEVVIDYTADGATLVAWRTLGATKDCDATIVAKMADGTEAGLREEININAIDCSEPDEIPDHDEDWSDYDPSNDNQDSDDGGFEDDGNDDDSGVSGGGEITACDVAILGSISNASNTALDQETRDAYRFDTDSASSCPDDPSDPWPSCSCSDMCDSEIQRTGNTLDQSLTIHEQVIEAGYTEGTPEYTEAFATQKFENFTGCIQDCETNRAELCE
ncbi:MAG: hypothetical protein JRE40_07815, partial [Deltaproteobacteria bacterium]|nr:hypothetical protein [Deltaproteobacteria bacterium]